MMFGLSPEVAGILIVVIWVFCSLGRIFGMLGEWSYIFITVVCIIAFVWLAGLVFFPEIAQPMPS